MNSIFPDCRRVETRDEMNACLAIRETVFSGEQGVDPSIDRDGLDDECFQYIADLAGRPVATARARLTGDKVKIERVAVVREMRGQGLGEELMRFMMSDLAQREGVAGRHFFLSSQSHAVAFYERLGFAVCSPEYMEAGIAHRDMRAEMVDEQGQA